MTDRDKIIRMAQEARLEGYPDELERFYRAAFAAGAAAEREACAKVVIDMVDNGHGVVDRITAAIRARGEA